MAVSQRHVRDGHVVEAFGNKASDLMTIILVHHPFVGFSIQLDSQGAALVGASNRVGAIEQCDPPVKLDFALKAKGRQIVKHTARRPVLLIRGGLIVAWASVQVRMAVAAGASISQGIPFALEGGKAVQGLTEVVEIRTLGRVHPAIQHAVIPFDDRIVGTLAWATKHRVNPDARQPQHQRRRHWRIGTPRVPIVKPHHQGYPPLRHHLLQTLAHGLRIDLVPVLEGEKPQRVRWPRSLHR